VVVQPSQVLETRKIVSPDSWAQSISRHGERWPFSVAVVRAAELQGPPFPDARRLVPIAYRSLGQPRNFGSFVELFDVERETARALVATEIHLNLTPDVQEYLDRRSTLIASKEINAEAVRMAQGIVDRVTRSGELGVRRNPVRTTVNFSELHPLLMRKWTGVCALCGRPLFFRPENRMLQASPDRIDSANLAYDDANVQIAHLACNWAKNEYGSDHFEEWLALVRGVDLPEVEHQA
jgi:hypothetical protein